MPRSLTRQSICALRVNQAPQHNRLIEELPAVPRFIDGLGVSSDVDPDGNRMA